MDPRSIHVGWNPHQDDYDVTEKQLRSHFASCGSITKVTVNNYKCYAFIEFSEHRAVESALGAQYRELCSYESREQKENKKKLKISRKRVTIPGYRANQNSPTKGETPSTSTARGGQRNESAREFLDNYAYKRNLNPPVYSKPTHIKQNGSEGSWQFQIRFDDVKIKPPVLIGKRMGSEDAAKERAACTWIHRMKGDAEADDWISAHQDSDNNVYSKKADRDSPRGETRATDSGKRYDETACDYLERVAWERKLDPPKYSPYKDNGTHLGGTTTGWQYDVCFAGFSVHGGKMSTEEEAKEKAASTILRRMQAATQDPNSDAIKAPSPRQTAFPSQDQLTDHALKNSLEAPVYTLVSETGPAHNKRFQYTVKFDSKTTKGAALARKKEAQESAAHEFINSHLRSLRGDHGRDRDMEIEAGPSSNPDNKRSSSESRESAENNQQHRKRPRACADEIVYKMRANRPSDTTATSAGVDIWLVDQRKGLDQSAAESEDNRELGCVLYYETRTVTVTKSTLGRDEITANKKLIDRCLKEGGANGKKTLTWSTEDSTFSSFSIHVMVYLQLSAGCGKPHVIIKKSNNATDVPTSEEEDGNFQKLLENLAFEKAVPIINAPGQMRKLYLCSVPKQKCFYGWFVEPKILQHVKESLRNKRLSCCFDLDDTLLKAFVINNVRDKRESENAEFVNTLERMFQQFDECEYIIHPMTGEKVCMTKEQVKMADGTIKTRPIVRIEINPLDPDSLTIVFTKINPEKDNTKMAFFLRPGWKTLVHFLNSDEGSNSGISRESNIFVSTKSEVEYSYEAWRLLDPKQELIQRSQYADRIRNVPNPVNEKDVKKSLHHSVLRYSAEEVEQMQDEVEQGLPNLPSLPYAFAIDDRDDVWKSNDMGAVYKCSEFHPYEYDCLRHHEQIKNYCRSEYMCVMHMIVTMQTLEKLNRYQRDQLQEEAENAMKIDRENVSPPSFYAPFFRFDVKPMKELLREAKNVKLVNVKGGEVLPRSQSSQIPQSLPPPQIKINSSSTQEEQRIKKNKELVQKVLRGLYPYTAGAKQLKGAAKDHLQAIEKFLRDKQDVLSKELSASTLLGVLEGLLKSKKLF